MWLGKVIAYTHIVLLLFEHAESLPTLLQGPVSQNMSVNSYANFDCIASGVQTVVWLANDTSINTIPHLIDHQPPPMKLNETATIYKMSFHVGYGMDLNLFNNTRISCVGFAQSTNDSQETTNESGPATLLLQGTLDDPVNLSVTFSSGSTRADWLPPYVMKGVEFSYLVNLTRYTDTTTVTSSEKINGSVNNWSTTAMDGSNCTVDEVCVQGVTIAGLGKPSCATTGETGDVTAPRRLINDQVAVVVSYENDSFVLSYEIVFDSCRKVQWVEYLTINISHSFTSEWYQSTPTKLGGNETAKAVVKLPTSFDGDIISVITLANQAGSSHSEHIQTRLSCLKNMTTSLNGLEFDVMCLFSTDCRSEGCELEFRCEDHLSPYFTTYLYRVGHISNTTMGKYSCVDIENAPCAITSIAVYDIYTEHNTPKLAFSQNFTCPVFESSPVPLLQGKPPYEFLVGIYVNGILTIASRLLVSLGILVSFGIVYNFSAVMKRKENYPQERNHDLLPEVVTKKF